MGLNVDAISIGYKCVSWSPYGEKITSFLLNMYFNFFNNFWAMSMETSWYRYLSKKFPDIGILVVMDLFVTPYVGMTCLDLDKHRCILFSPIQAVASFLISLSLGATWEVLEKD